MYLEGTVQASAFRSTIANVLTTPLGEANPCAEFSITTTGTGAVKLNMAALTGGIVPSGWRIYRGTAAGSETLLATLPGDQTTFYDDGSLTPGGTAVPGASSGTLAALPSNTPAPSAGFVTSWLGQSLTQNTGTDTIAYDALLAQAFIPNYANLSEIDLPLTVAGAPTGNVVLQIFGVAQNQPSQTTYQNYPNTQNVTALAQVTVPVGNVQNFSGNGTYTKFTFSAPVALTPGVPYYFVLSLDASACTKASGNNITIATRSSASTTMTTVFNNYMTGARTVLTTTAWTATAQNTSLCFQVYAAGVLAAAQYYYRVSMVTGWVIKQTLSGIYYENAAAGTRTGSVLYSSGASNNENIYALVDQGAADANQNVWLAILEHYGLNTHLIYGLNGTIGGAYTNGTGLTTSSNYFNLRSYSVAVNSAAVGTSTNCSYRAHVFYDHFFLSVAGDSSIANWQENCAFVGKLVGLSATDKCYAITTASTAGSSTYANWAVLRDYQNNVNVKAYCYFMIYPMGNIQNSDNTDAIPYLNQYTQNYDSIKLYVGDSNGVRGYVPDMLLFPTAVTGVVNNHDVIAVSGTNYKFYKPNNYQAFSYQQDTTYSTVPNGYVVQARNFYPAVNAS